MKLRLLSIIISTLLLAACSFDEWEQALAQQSAASNNTVPNVVIPAATPTLVQTFSTGAACYDPFFSLSRGIAIGDSVVLRTPQFGTVTNPTAQVALRPDHTQQDESGFVMTSGETFTVIDGPFCFYTRNAQSRWWSVRHNGSRSAGFIDEYESIFGVRHVYLEASTPAPSLALFHFAVSIPSAFGRPANVGETIYLSWDVVGASNVTVSRQDTGEVLGNSAHNAIPFVVPDNSPSITFVLSANDNQIQETRTLQIDCQSCSVAPPTVAPSSIELSYQTFEYGAMLYRTDTRQIYVLFNNGSAQVFADVYQGQSLAIEESPPAGYLQPQFGFGYVWLTGAGIRDSLGWATQAEQYFQSVLDASVAGEFRVQLPDGRLIAITGTTWRLV